MHIALILSALFATGPAPAPADSIYGETVFAFEASHEIDQLVLSPDGRRVAYTHFEASDEGTYVLEVRRLSGGPPVRLVPHRRYSPCVCDGGVGTVSWLDDRRVLVVARYDTDERDGELRITFDAWTGRMISLRDVPLAREGPRSVAPERRAAWRNLRRAFSKIPPGFETEASLDLGVEVRPNRLVIPIGATAGYTPGLWAVDLRTSAKCLLAPLDESRFMRGGAALGDSAVVLFVGEDSDEVCLAGGGRLTTLATLPKPVGGVRELVPVRGGRRRLLFLLARTAGAAGEVWPGILYETDGRTAHAVEGDSEVYAASTDARGRLVAVSTGQRAEVRRLRFED